MRTPVETRIIRAELVRLVAAAVVPVVIFSIGVAIWSAIGTRDAVERGVQDTTRALSLALDRQIAAWAGALSALSTSRAIDTGDMEAFRRQAGEVAERHGGWITLIDRSGRQVINTLSTSEAPLGVSTERYLDAVFESGQMVVSDLFVGKVSGREIIGIFLPVHRGGELRYALNLAVTPERLSALLAGQELPEGWLAVLTDSEFRIIARARDPGTSIGKSTPDWYIDGVRRAESGMLSGPSFLGTEVRLAYERLPGSGWSVAVAVPASELAAASRRPLIAMTVAGAVLLMLAIALSFLYARRIHDAVVSAEAENRSRDFFLTTVSHELRTPIAAIMGWIAVIRTRRGDAGKVDEALAIIERNATQQAKLIDDLLDISRSISGKLQVERERTDLSEAVQEAIDGVRPAATEKEIDLHVAVPRGIAIDGDYGRLVQIADNLLSNAIKFTPRRGRVEVSLARADGSAELVVRDSGPGIDPALKPRLFDRFAQSAGRQTHQPGLGLGLAIVRNLTELHGGKVTAESDAGSGATFRVRLPILAGERPASRDRGRAPAAALSGVRVLVVDDHADTRQWLSDLLSARGAVTREASYAGEALSVQQEFRAAVIVSDIAMPRGDGYDLIRKLRAREGAARTGTIAFTALASGADRQRVLADGFDAVIAKGGDPAVLISTVARLSARHSG